MYKFKLHQTMNLFIVQIILIWLAYDKLEAIKFDGVTSLHIWITVSSLANNDPNNMKALLFRQIELNWINAPLDDPDDYIGLYLDSRPDENTLPVSVHKLNGLMNGQIITDYYLPQIDFLNQTFTSKSDTSNSELEKNLLPETIQFHSSTNSWQRFNEPLLSHRNLNDNSKSPSLIVDECIGYCIAYHSRNKILARNCLKTNPNWMRNSFQFIGTRSLPSLMIPGSHNSATYPKQLDKTNLQMINKYQINQDESIFNQLIYGVRYLDLRVGFTKVKQRQESFWIYHDIFRTEVTVREVIDQVKKFLDMTTHEIIIMDFHRFTVGFHNENLSIQKERHAKLIDLLFKHLGNYIVPSYLGQHAPLNEYQSMGKRLIIGYASRSMLLGPQADNSPAFGLLSQSNHQVRDIDSVKQDNDDLIELSKSNDSDPTDRRMASRIYNKLKSLKVISNSFSKRNSNEPRRHNLNNSAKLAMNEQNSDTTNLNEQEYNNLIAKSSLFFPPVRHLWPNKDTIEGLSQYMNDTTCRKYFGELRSMMVELTPTVFGAISDKYDGNRKLAQLVNRHVTDWIRERWLHCINIVASDFFLGNDLIKLAIYANKRRVINQNFHLDGNDECKSFRYIEHLIDKSKIPIQFVYHGPQANEKDISRVLVSRNRDNDIITHTSSDGNQILLRPLTPSQMGTGVPRERRESFVENFADSFTNLFSSFKRFLNF